MAWLLMLNQKECTRQLQNKPIYQGHRIQS